MSTLRRPALAALATAIATTAVLACAGCTGDADDGTGSTPTPTTATEGSGSGSPGSTQTTTDGPFDCTAVAAAQQELNDAGDAELARLGIDRGDQRAFTVTVLSASQHAAEYWQAVSKSATPLLPAPLRTDLDKVTGYWDALDPELDAITIADSSVAAVQGAANRLASVTDAYPDDALAPAQQRVQDALSASCGTEPEPAPSPTSS